MLREQIKSLIKDKIKERGYKLVRVEIGSQKGGMTLTIFIDKEGGVDVEDCAEVSRLIDPIIEKAGLIKNRYFLQVSSPGGE